MRYHRRGGFTLIELLIVVAIVAVLIGLLIPAVQKVREAAARAKCQNNLKQIGLAVNQFEGVHGYLPPRTSSMTLKSTGTFAGISCSLFVRLLPFIEQQSVFGLADLNLSVTMQPALNAQQVPLFICPSDLNIRLSTDTPAAYPATYGAGWGDWFGFEFTTAKFGNGAFPETSYPSQRGIRQSEITDGTSYTVGLADVKAFTTYLVRPNSPSANPPATPAALLALGGTANVAGGHASWANGLAFQTGLSFVFPPNTEVPYTNPADGTTYDVDWVGGTVYSCGAVTARSYHSGGVNAAFMDGSVRFITNSIPQATWRALGTRNGGETVDVTQY